MIKSAALITGSAGPQRENGREMIVEVGKKGSRRRCPDQSGENARVGGKLPRLTLMEEVLLLGIMDKQEYLSFWIDNVSYALRRCILIELALRRRIGVKCPQLPGRPITVISTRQTGETLLDKMLKMMKQTEDAGEKMGCRHLGRFTQWCQVRERLAKGLVDNGVLRTEKRDFLLFDMATHPVADAHVKAGVVNRVVALLTSGTSPVPPSALDAEGTQCRTLRVVCLACAAYAASVLDNAFGRLGYEEREAAFGRCDEILGEFSMWPSGGGVAGGVDAGFELVAAVLEMLSKLDSLL
ncbi:Golgi phosphoprotein 3-domain-containing protein [Mycena olivaceomarginata]|nr:Golgi phosphoprotein 3-domain-containing protein [Mycena olivaceomarginata]